MMRPKTLLVVEDNALNREILVDILCSQYHVLEAENGQIALELLAEHKNQIALILLDMHMPVMDGITFLDHLRTDPDLSLIPVIVTTQSDTEADEIASLSHGAADFVPKPYRPQIILQRVANLISLRENASLSNLLRYDPLTGLFTKEYFYQLARGEIEANPDLEYNIVVSNLENFKLYNDLYGVTEGDRLLKAVARIAVDALGPDVIMARIRADRFVNLAVRTNRYCNEYFSGFNERLNQIHGMSHVSQKWGIYEIHDRSIPIAHMCDRAQLAADRVKGVYGQYYSVYDDVMRAQMIREQSIIDAMTQSLMDGEFQIYYQPKYALADDSLSGAEALVRWVHPELGFLSPAEFIPLFEKNGFITQMDRYIWKRACQDLSRWQAQGLRPVPVSVNISRSDFYRMDLVKEFVELAAAYELDPSLLHLEVTESVYVENPQLIFATVRQLQKAGFCIEIDDFGAGYSSLSILGDSHVDVLKLDIKFVQNETAKPEDQSILPYVVSMARQLNMKVVAEGVETVAQRERLRSIGCDYGQGYFFSKPMTLMSYEKLLASHALR